MTSKGFALSLGLSLAAAAAAPARAQEGASPEGTTAGPELSRIRQSFEYGKYKDALARAEVRIDAGSLSDAELIELHLYAGVSAFHLNQPATAERHFSALLRLDPDYNLDPFAHPPGAIRFFDRVRKGMAGELETLRQERRLEAARRKRAEEDRERARREEEERRRRMEELSNRVTVKTVEKQSYWVNFAPFGAGQFQQGRTTLGIFLASAEGALAATSAVAFLAEAALRRCTQYTVDNVQSPSGKYTVTLCGVPPERRTEDRIWRGVKYGTGGAFYLLYAYGVIDALLHHQDERVTTETARAPSTPPPLYVDVSPSGEVAAGVNLRF